MARANGHMDALAVLAALEHFTVADIKCLIELGIDIFFRGRIGDIEPLRPWRLGAGRAHEYANQEHRAIVVDDTGDAARRGDIGAAAGERAAFWAVEHAAASAARDCAKNAREDDEWIAHGRQFEHRRLVAAAVR